MSAGGLTFYAALAMTKAQQNSSLPTDSGVYRRNQDGAWTRCGPKIHIISGATADARDPGSVYFACGNGLLRVRRDGAEWRMLTGWRISDAFALGFDAAEARRFYLATAGGVWRSDDAGESWREASAGLGSRFAPTLATDRTRAGRAIVGTEDGLFLTGDGAASWTRLRGPAAPVWRVRQSAADPALWLAATQGAGVWRSRDGGTSWTACADLPAGGHFYDVALDPRDPTRMAAGGWETGAWLSSDGGASWRDVSGGLPARRVFTVTFDPEGAGRLWASVFEEGVFQRENDGTTWQAAGLAGAYVYEMAALPRSF